MIKYVGKHLILDLYNCQNLQLDDLNNNLNFLNDLCCKFNIKIVHKSWKQFEPFGLTILYVISESHISIHTYPEYKFVSIDLYSCNHDIDFNEIVNEFIKFYDSNNYEFTLFNRGNLNKIEKLLEDEMIYPFRCEECGKEFELQMSIKEYENFDFYCPFCNTKALKRIYTPVTFQLKGNGWYKDHTYSITDREIQKNKDKMYKIEDIQNKKMKVSKEV